MKKFLFAMAAAGMIANLQAQGIKADGSAAGGGDEAGGLIGAAVGAAVGGVEEQNAVAKTLNGHLIEVDGKKVKDGKLDSVDFYLVYHSASW